MKKGLGKGLGGFFGEETVAEVRREERKPAGKTAKTAASKASDAPQGVTELLLSHIEPNPDQPRKTFEETALEALAESIRQHGVITPITVRRGTKKDSYQIIAGERRWRAARKAGLKRVPAFLIEADESETMQMALIENLQRTDLSPIEEAEGYDRLMQVYGLTQDEVAGRVGKSRPAVANALRLLSLPPAVRQMVEDGLLSGGHARAVLAVSDEKQREQAAKEMQKLSVRQAEALAKKLNKKPVKKGKKEEFAVNYMTEIEKTLESTLGRKVTIQQGKHSGTLTLEYYDADDMERLIEALQGLRV